MARRYNCVNAHSAPHNIIAHFVDDRVLHPSLRKLHVRVPNRFQCRVQKQLFINQVRAASKERCHDVPVSVRSRPQFLYSRSSGKNSQFSFNVNIFNISLTPSSKKKIPHQNYPRPHKFRFAVPCKSRMLQRIPTNSFRQDIFPDTPSRFTRQDQKSIR